MGPLFKLVQLAEATVQDRQHVVLTMCHGSDYPGALALGKQKETIDASLWFR